MRIFHYSHDTYGEGHLRQTLSTAKQIAVDFPEATQLVMSGTAQSQRDKLPERLDFIKLPRMDESVIGDFHTPSLLLPFGIIHALREKLILETIRHFNPDVVLVKSPVKAQGEMLPALDYLKRNRPETKLLMNRGHNKVKRAIVDSRALLARKMFAVPHIQAQTELYNERRASYDTRVDKLIAAA